MINLTEKEYEILENKSEILDEIIEYINKNSSVPAYVLYEHNILEGIKAVVDHIEVLEDLLEEIKETTDRMYY